MTSNKLEVRVLLSQSIHFTTLSHCLIPAVHQCAYLLFQLYKKARRLGYGESDVSAVFRAASN